MDGPESKFENERRLLLALLLSSAVLFLTPYVFRYFYPPADPVPPPGQAELNAVPAPAELTSIPDPAPAEAAQPVTPSEASLQPTVAAPLEVVVRGDDLLFRFSNLGALPTGVQLTNYRDHEGNPLELLPQTLPSNSFRPFQLSVFDEAASIELASAVFELEKPTSILGALDAPLDLTFRYRSQRLEVVRTYQIPAAGFLISTTTDMRLDGVPVPHRTTIGPGVGPMSIDQAGGWMYATGDFGAPQLAYSLDGSVERQSSVEEAQTLAVRAEWVAFDSQYFSYLTFGPGIQQIRLSSDSWSRIDQDGAEVLTPLVRAEVEYAPSTSHDIFFGPKDLSVLRGIDRGIGTLVDFGIFGILVEPLLFILKAIHGVVGNYGWSIIILTFFINLLLVPIRYKQTTSMKKMSVLQPQMKAIQERYKKLDRSDPKKQEMNKEVMELYKKHGVNPLGGCLPLLVQMPFLFAFYRMLAGAIELREAPFMFWITDLSRPDAYYVTPLIMGVTMVAQQKMTPATGDATQRRMMMMMPILFTYFFLSVSSGLAIYFLFSNLFGIAFMWGMQRMSKEEEIKPSSNPKGNSKKGKASKR